MQSKPTQRRLSFIYLAIIPIVTSIVGFVFAPISYKIYVPVWIVNVCLTVIASWILGAYAIKKDNTEKKQLAISSLFLIGPLLLFGIFGGMGAPPDTARDWVTTSTIQQIRYSVLIIGGIVAVFGFALLWDRLKNSGESFYSLLGFIAIMIAAPLFILNMSFWHSFVLESYKLQLASSSTAYPEWNLPVHKQYELISIVEVGLTYLATTAYAASLRSLRWFGKTSSGIYIIISLLAFLLVAFYPLFAKAIAAIGFFPLLIPALPFLMPYYIGINLLRRAGNI